MPRQTIAPSNAQPSGARVAWLRAARSAPSSAPPSARAGDALRKCRVSERSQSARPRAPRVAEERGDGGNDVDRVEDVTRHTDRSAKTEWAVRMRRTRVRREANAPGVGRPSSALVSCGSRRAGQTCGYLGAHGHGEPPRVGWVKAAARTAMVATAAPSVRNRPVAAVFLCFLSPSAQPPKRSRAVSGELTGHEVGNPARPGRPAPAPRDSCADGLLASPPPRTWRGERAAQRGRFVPERHLAGE